MDTGCRGQPLPPTAQVILPSFADELFSLPAPYRCPSPDVRVGLSMARLRPLFEICSPELKNVSRETFS